MVFNGLWVADVVNGEDVTFLRREEKRRAIFRSPAGSCHEYSKDLAGRAIRATLRGTLADEVAAAVVHERAVPQRLMRTADCREGVAAVAERRPGRFTGR